MIPTRLILYCRLFKQDQELFVTRRSKDGRLHGCAPFERSFGEDELFYFPQHSFMDERIANDPCPAVRFFFTGFKLRFEQRDELSGGTRQCNGGRNNFFERNKRTIYDNEIDRRIRGRKLSGGERASVRFFQDEHARVLTQLPRKLAVTHIDGIDFCGAMLQQAIGESARGRAEVQGG